MTWLYNLVLGASHIKGYYSENGILFSFVVYVCRMVFNLATWISVLLQENLLCFIVITRMIGLGIFCLVLVFNSFHTLWRSCYHSVSYGHKGLPSAVGCPFMINTAAADLSSRGTMCVSIAPTHGAWPERRKWQHLSWLSSGCKHHRRRSIYKFKSELLWRSNDKKAPASCYNLLWEIGSWWWQDIGVLFPPMCLIRKGHIVGDCCHWQN